MDYTDFRDIAFDVRDSVGGLFNKKRRMDDFDALIARMGLERQSKARSQSLYMGMGVFAFGVLTGSVVGLLFAPKRGKELRDEAKDMARDKLPFLHRGSLPGQEQIYEELN